MYYALYVCMFIFLFNHHVASLFLFKSLNVILVSFTLFWDVYELHYMYWWTIYSVSIWWKTSKFIDRRIMKNKLKWTYFWQLKIVKETTDHISIQFIVSRFYKPEQSFRYVTYMLLVYYDIIHCLQTLALHWQLNIIRSFTCGFSIT